MDLAQLSLRQGERGLIIGRSGSGKSTLAERLIDDFVRRYPTGVTLVVDSKPRFRGSQFANGRPAKRLYKGMDHGTTLAGSVVVSSREELDLALKLGARLIIAQDVKSLTGEDEPNLGLLTQIVGRFMATARTGKPRLVYIDEALDFYAPNGQAKRGTSGSILRVARAGREKGVALLVGCQRTKGIPVQLLAELRRLYLMAMDFVEDIAHLREAGVPVHLLDTPTNDHLFLYWTKDSRASVFGPYRLNL